MSTLSVAKVLFEKETVNPVFMALIFVGLFIKFALSDVNLSTDGTTGPASSLIWGYGLVIFSLIGIIIVNVAPGSNEWNDIKNLPWMLISTVSILIWMVGMNIQYFTPINLKAVPDQYFMWSNYSTVLLFCLISITVYRYALVNHGEQGKKLASNLFVFSGMILLFNLIAVAIQQVVLNCFYVDG